MASFGARKASGACCYGSCQCAGFRADFGRVCACGHHEMLHAPPPRDDTQTANPRKPCWLYVRPKQGLCNRIRVVTSTLLLVDDLARGKWQRRGPLARAFRGAGVGPDAAAPLCLRSDAYEQAAQAYAAEHAPLVRIAIDWETTEPACATRYDRLFAPHAGGHLVPLPPFANAPRDVKAGDEQARVAAEMNAEIALEEAFAAARADDAKHDVYEANADPTPGAEAVPRVAVLAERKARTAQRNTARTALEDAGCRHALWRARALAVVWSRVTRFEEPKWSQQIALDTYKRLRDANKAAECVSVLNDSVNFSKGEDWVDVMGADPVTMRLSTESLRKPIWRNDVVVLESLSAYYPPGHDRVPDGVAAPDGRTNDAPVPRDTDASDDASDDDLFHPTRPVDDKLVSRLRCAALNSLRPATAVRRRVALRDAPAGRARVGFHVRRTDNCLSIARSPLGGFLRGLDRLGAPTGAIVEADRRCLRRLRGSAARRPPPAPKLPVEVFIASDAPKAVADLQILLAKATPNRWLVEDVEDALDRKRALLDGVANRSCASGVQDALVDLLELAQADAIVGSYWSSFSEAAALWRRVPLVVVDEHRPREECERTIDLSRRGRLCPY